MKGWPYFSPSLLEFTIRRHWRDVSYLATNREALLDRAAVILFCWSFKHLAKQCGGRMSTTVNGDYADAEPVLYDVEPYFGSRNRPDGFDEVEIYADVSATVRRAEYWLRNEQDDTKAAQGKTKSATRCDECGIESVGSVCQPCIVMGQAL